MDIEDNKILNELYSTLEDLKMKYIIYQQRMQYLQII